MRCTATPLLRHFASFAGACCLRCSPVWVVGHSRSNKLLQSTHSQLFRFPTFFFSFLSICPRVIMIGQAVTLDVYVAKSNDERANWSDMQRERKRLAPLARDGSVASNLRRIAIPAA
jgi:hypothetical protein